MAMAEYLKPQSRCVNSRLGGECVIRICLIGLTEINTSNRTYVCTIIINVNLCVPRPRPKGRGEGRDAQQGVKTVRKQEGKMKAVRNRQKCKNYQ